MLEALLGLVTLQTALAFGLGLSLPHIARLLRFLGDKLVSWAKGTETPVDDQLAKGADKALDILADAIGSVDRERLARDLADAIKHVQEQRK